MMRKIFLILNISLILISCEKWIEVDPPIDQIINPQPFDNDQTAEGILTGIYSEMMRSNSLFSSGLTSLFTSLSSDELYYYSPGFRDEFFSNNITQLNHLNLSNYFWQPAYRYIYASNLALEELEKTSSLSSSVKTRLSGEAKFVRAFCYFHLANLFGDVPLVLNTDYRANEKLFRSPVERVYQNIINDLLEAERLLPESYILTEKIRPNKWTATALLSKVYLYQNTWDEAEASASEIINSGQYSLDSVLDNIFLKNSNEAIWQLRPVNPNQNTWIGNAIIPVNDNSLPTYVVRKEFLDYYVPTDKRKTAWFKTRIYQGQTITYPFKYKVFGNNAPLTEYYMVFRYAEIILIRAEAQANKGNLSDAIDDLNLIRNRAGLNSLSMPLSKDELLEEIYEQRKLELAFEWGNRWYDLKRTDNANNILINLKPNTWQVEDILWPIPQDQIDLNNQLTQNPGY